MAYGLLVVEPMCRPFFAVMLVAASLSTAVPARADDAAAAGALFADGKALQEAGDWAGACPKFEASFELDPTLGTLLNVADCREHTNDLAVALAAWERAIELAKEKKDPREAFATERRDKLAPRVPKLALDVSQGAEKLEVFVDGKPVPEAQFGLPFDVEPREVSIEVRRGDDVLESKKTTFAEGASERVSLDLAAIAKAHPPRTKKPQEEVSPAQRYAGITILSVGVGAIATFAILEGAAYAQRAEADGPSGCVDKPDGTTYCSPQGQDLAEYAGDLAEIGQWMGIAGLTTAAVGLTVFLTAPKEDPDAKAKARVTAVAPWLLPSGLGVVVGGRL